MSSRTPSPQPSSSSRAGQAESSPTVRPEGDGADRPVAAFDADPLDRLPTELVDSVRRLLDHHRITSGREVPGVLAVVSSLHGEGTTTVSQALAAVLATDEKRIVCWVDLSWASPGAPVPNEGGRTGLFEVVTGEVELTEAISRSEPVPKLLALHGGAVPAERHAVIARSRGLSEVVDLLRSECDHVVFDMPPMSVSSQALPLMRQADAYVLVARHGAVTRRQVRDTVQELTGFEMLGAVLNGYASKVPRFIRRLVG